MTNSWRGTNVLTSSADLQHNEFMKRIRKSLYYSKLPVINCLSLPVTELAAELFTEVKSGHTLEKLDVEEASRISRKACVSPCSLVLALLYIERIKKCNPEYLHQVAPSELFLVSLMVASKFLNDDGEENEVFNKEWANSGQVTISRMNKLEKDFLAAIDWTVLVQHQDFWERLQQLEKNVAYREVHKRRWCTYTELSCLINSVQLIRIAQTLISVSSICLATYAAGLATLLGSTLVANFIVQSCLPGTSLSSRQSTNLSVNLTTNLTSIDLTDSLINVQSQEIDDNGLPISDSESVADYSATKETNNAEEARSKWWLNSTMNWPAQVLQPLEEQCRGCKLHQQIMRYQYRLLVQFDARYEYRVDEEDRDNGGFCTGRLSSQCELKENIKHDLKLVRTNLGTIALRKCLSVTGIKNLLLAC